LGFRPRADKTRTHSSVDRVEEEWRRRRRTKREGKKRAFECGITASNTVQQTW
jgi:hypothetical protein